MVRRQARISRGIWFDLWQHCLQPKPAPTHPTWTYPSVPTYLVRKNGSIDCLCESESGDELGMHAFILTIPPPSYAPGDDGKRAMTRLNT